MSHLLGFPAGSSLLTHPSLVCASDLKTVPATDVQAIERTHAQTRRSHTVAVPPAVRTERSPMSTLSQVTASGASLCLHHEPPSNSESKPASDPEATNPDRRTLWPSVRRVLMSYPKQSVLRVFPLRAERHTRMPRCRVRDALQSLGRNSNHFPSRCKSHSEKNSRIFSRLTGRSSPRSVTNPSINLAGVTSNAGL